MRTVIGLKDITVASGKIYPITDSDRTFNKATIKQGGRLFIETAAEVRINKLVKPVASSAKSKAKTSATSSKSKAKPASGKAKSKSKS